MKKLWIFSAFLLICICGNVKAEESCKATLSHPKLYNKKVEIVWSNTTIKEGFLYSASLSANGKTEIAFCLDAGIGTNRTYVKTTARNVKVTTVMRKAFAFMEGHTDLNNDANLHRYIVAQIMIWLEQAGFNPLDSSNISNVRIAVWYAYTNIYGNDNIPIKQNELIDEFLATTPVSASLYTFESETNPTHYQRFISKLNMAVCDKEPGRTYCPSPNDKIDITSCVENTGDLVKCIQDNCPSNNTCNGYKLKVVSNPAVCANDNSTHYGEFYQELDTSECGDANEYGAPTGRPIGDYCTLYCKESVLQQYPGGISSPLPVGTNIVWPTSSATEKTVWGNLYSLRYTGTKQCKVVLNPNKNPVEDIQRISSELNNYNNRNEYERIRENGGQCSNNYGQDLSTLQKQHDQAINSFTNAKQNAASCESELTNLRNRESELSKEIRDLNSSSCSTTCNGSKICITACEVAKQQTLTIKRNEINQVQEDISRKVLACNRANDDVKQAETNRDMIAKQITSINTKINECNKYMEMYNRAIEVLKGINTCNNYSITEDIYSFQSSTSISYSDEQYGTLMDLVAVESNTICNNCEAIQTRDEELIVSPNRLIDVANRLVNNIQSREIAVVKNITYALPENGYRYINKKNNQPLKSPIGDVINVGYTFLPTSYNASVKKPYNLNIIVNSLGEDGKFTEAANNRPYTCNYSLTKTTSDECVCPEGTEHAGEDLSSIIYNGSTTSSPMTCADAQLKYCNANVVTYCPSDQNIEITSCLNSGNSYRYCVDTLCPNGAGDKFCPNDKSIKITACLNNGNSYQYCVDSLCNAGNVDYHCPAGTFNDGMDIKPCVFANIHMGLNQALQYCVDTVCPYTGGVNIIYRTISLRNPFPGKTAGVGLNIKTNQFSLDHYYGRYPGANWNSVDLVKKQILYNRNVEENAVYQKEPLYSFILDTNTIKKIRKYNDDQEKSGGYADFTLNCNSNGIACISNEFVRKQEYGMISGVCSKATHGEFYTCSER